MAQFVFLVCLVVVLTSVVFIPGEAVRPWFGDHNQYKCHCNKNECTPTGKCTPPHQCVRGWFGPECQYADLAAKAIYPASTWEDLVTDDAIWDTCIWEDTSSSSITIFLDKVYPLTWMRVYTQGNKTCDINEEIDMFPSKPAGCIQIEDPSGFYDIYCKTPIGVSSITLWGSCSYMICSVHVSGGRNVAYKERASQKAYYTQNGDIFGPDCNVNDERNRDECSQTEVNCNPNHWWKVTYAYPVKINRYVIYNRNDTNKTETRRRGYHLETEDKTGHVIFKHVDSKPQANDVYEFIDWTNSRPAAATKITTFDTDSLNFRKIEIYGDTDCAKGFYGRECKQRCSRNCVDGRCFPSTGACQAGCKRGYIGIKCQPETACAKGFYGRKCEQRCSSNCVGGKCFPSTGECKAGCKPGYTGKTCQTNTACAEGFYGNECKQQCSSNCVGGKCFPSSGECKAGCKPGYGGKTCQMASPQEATSGDNMPAASSEAARPWFGENNEYKCHCEKNACTPTGQCTPPHRCERGWFGPQCQIEDLAAKTNYSPTSWEHIVTDGNEDTCTTEETDPITITLDKDYTFMLMTFYTKGNETCNLYDEFRMIPSHLDPAVCDKHVYVSGFYDIKCYSGKYFTIRSFSLYGHCTRLLCSVYVSGEPRDKENLRMLHSS